MNELLESIRSDLLSRRMLPALVVALVALVAAVGYAVTSGGSSATPTVSTPSSPPPSPTATLPVVTAQANPHEAVAETPGGTRYQSSDPTRNPFTPLSTSTSPSGKSAAGSKSGGSSTSTKTGSSSNGATTGGSPPAPATKPPAKVAPKPTHTGLSSTQSYEVALSLTSQGGNLDAIDSLERLSGLPSEQQPLLVYLGVLEGGKHALFVVQPGTVVSGPGGCTPGPTDCEILSLAPGQIESLAVSTGGVDSGVALFAVTAIKVDNHPTVAAADRARREAAAYGRALLQASTLPALALFEYQPTVGAVVDLRNLTVGGEK